MMMVQLGTGVMFVTTLCNVRHVTNCLQAHHSGSSINDVSRVPSTSTYGYQVVSQFFGFIHFLLTHFHLGVYSCFTNEQVVCVMFGILCVFSTTTLRDSHHFVLATHHERGLEVYITRRQCRFLIHNKNYGNSVPQVSTLGQVTLPTAIVMILIMVQKGCIIKTKVNESISMSVYHVNKDANPHGVITLLEEKVLKDNVFVTVYHRDL